MQILKKCSLSDGVNCPYIDNEKFTQLYFFAYGIDHKKTEALLSRGWRHFGHYFFRPVCSNCHKCQPLRVVIDDFKPSKSQRRVIRKNSSTVVKVTPLVYSDKLYNLYLKHSTQKLDNNPSTKEEFKNSFMVPAVDSFIIEYHIGNIFIGAGIVDRTDVSLSSVYFFFDPDYSHLSPGKYSILCEIELAKKFGLKYYYLGYYIEEAARMNYKGKYNPSEIYNFKTRIWSNLPKP